MSNPMDSVNELIAMQTEDIRKERDKLRSALKFLYEQVLSLEDYTVTRDLDRHKAEACFDGAIDEARKALR